MKQFITPVLVTLLSFSAFAAEVPVTLISLVHDLGGDNEAARVQARQLLPREGLDALHGVLPLLYDGREHVWRAAFNVIEQIANEAAAPGREADRALVTEALYPLVAADEPMNIKERGLKLLAVVLPVDGDIGPIAALLDDESLRERTRQILEELGTPAAAEVLAEALPGAEPGFQVALLDALGQMRIENSLDIIGNYAERGGAAVRAAAIRALAWRGDADYLPVAREIAEQAGDDTRFDAVDAYLRLAMAAGEGGGRVEAVRDAFRHAFEVADTDVLRGGALNGLGRYGDERDIPFILAAVNDDNVETLGPPALNALAWPFGRAADAALEDGYGPVPLRMQAAFVDLIGRRGDPRFLPILTQAVASKETGLRQTAYRALASTGAPEAVAPLAAALEGATDEDRVLLLAGLESLAQHFTAQNEAANAGTAWLALYRATDNDEQRARAADGLRRFPVAEAADVLIEIVNPEEIGGMPVGALAGMATALRDAGLAAKADEVLGVMRGKLSNGQAVQEIINYAHAAGTIADWEPLLGFVRDWQLLGPFPFSRDPGFQTPPFDPAAPDFSASYEGKEGPVTWKAHTQEGLPPHVNLMGLIGAMDNATAYAATTITSAQGGPAEIRAGSDDGLRLWLNGEEVHANNTDRGAAIDSDIVPVSLKAGDNLLIAEICQNAGGWGFMLRVTGPKGAGR